MHTEGLVVNDCSIFPLFIGFTGDNLGLHQLLGFVECFQANFPCRFCRAPRSLCRSLTREDTSLLRNVDNYGEDLTKEVSESGINDYCILNEIPGYHVTENNVVDAMHDVLEGLVNFGMTAIISHYVSTRMISLEDLNILINPLFSNLKIPLSPLNNVLYSCLYLFISRKRSR